ncbi:MAG: SpoIIE family protein phosphatase [Pseudolysinimonas sp.]
MVAVDENGTLDVLIRTDLFGMPSDDRFPNLCRTAAAHYGAELVVVAMAGPESVWFQSRHGVVSESIERAGGFCETAILSDDPLIVEDVLADERFKHHPAAAGPNGVRFFAGYPFHGPDGERIGVLAMFDLKPRTFGADEVEPMKVAVDWIESELQGAQDLDRAADVQRAMLPRNLAPLAGYEIAGVCIPAKSVGGDFYDWYAIDGGLAFTLGDVMGKGIASAIIAAAVRAVVRSAAHESDVVEAVERSATALSTDLGEVSSFVTMFHARMRASDGLVSYVDAGHGLTVVVRVDGTADLLVTTDLPLGTLDDGWSSHQVTLEPGDMLVSFSDGVLDLFDGTLAVVDEVVAMAREASTPRSLVDTLERLARRDGAPDDVTVLAVRRGLANDRPNGTQT